MPAASPYLRTWPARLWIVRHGQSAGNIAHEAADLADLDRIALTSRDVDIPLSPLGRDQAHALGAWFSHLDVDDQPQVVLASPYARAVETARLFLEAKGAVGAPPICVDERLREKEMGILDGLTSRGVANHYPEQFALRQTLGKFYHRAPGGESWCDVIFRLRALLDTICLHHANDRVMVFAHQVVVLCFRYILEGLDEAQLLAIDSKADVANCSVTEYVGQKGTGELALSAYNVTAPLVIEDAPVTREPDAMVAARG